MMAPGQAVTIVTTHLLASFIEEDGELVNDDPIHTQTSLVWINP
jgi:hypothetical protein